MSREIREKTLSMIGLRTDRFRKFMMKMANHSG
jgi:hypothetical protein